MNEREWIRNAPIRDVILAAILRGCDGYPDENTERPQYVLHSMTKIIRMAGAPEFGPPFKEMTVAELREWAKERFGDIEAAA